VDTWTRKYIFDYVTGVHLGRSEESQWLLFLGFHVLEIRIVYTNK
jgi:hypothetical protein